MKGFGVLRFRVEGSGFEGLGLWVWGAGLGFWGFKGVGF